MDWLWVSIAAAIISIVLRDPDLFSRLARKQRLFRHLTPRGAFALLGCLSLATAVLVVVYIDWSQAIPGHRLMAYGPGAAGILLLAAAIWLMPAQRKR